MIVASMPWLYTPSMANMAQLQQVLWGIKITKVADPDTQTHCEHLTIIPEILY